MSRPHDAGGLPGGSLPAAGRPDRAGVLPDETGLEPFRVHLPERGLTLAGLQRGLTLAGSAPRGSARPLLLFVHGLAGYGAYWRRLIRRLPAGWPLLAPDLRGHGDSDKPEGGYDLRSVSADLVALLDAFGAERAALVGHSWGGKVALAAAALHPHRFSHVVAVDPASPAPHTTLREVRDGLVHYFDTLYGPHESFEAAVERVRSLVEAIPGRRWTPESERNLRVALRRRADGRWVGATPPSVVRAVLASSEGEDAASLLGRIRCPVTLAIIRERTGEFAQLRARLAPEVDLCIEVFDSSHWIPSDRPDELARLIQARVG